jgi:opacity protein-like surface antigen
MKKLISYVRRIRRAISAAAAAAAIGGTLTAPAYAQNAEEVLGSKWHPFSACNMAIGAGMGYGRLATADNWSGIGTGSGVANLPLSGDGAIAKLGVGCDMHFGRAVVGGLVDYAFGNVGTRAGDLSIDVNKQLFVGGRLGYMATDQWMLYTSLGLAWANADVQNSGGTESKALKGYRLGLGSEIRVAQPVWLRLEGNATRYDATDFGSGATLNPTVYTMNAAVVFKF